MLRLALAAVLLLPAMANAQMTVSSKATLGWTSNAEGAAGGTGDNFIEHSHALGFSHSAGDHALRGSLSFGETRYARLWQENDRQIGADLAGEWHVAPDMTARATLALAWHEEGQAIAFGPDIVAATTPFLKGSIGFEIESRFGGTLLAAGVSHAVLAHGSTRFSAPFTPLRSRADAAVWSGDLRLSHALGETVSLTGLVRGAVQTISREDQALYGRLPVRALRLAAGLDVAIPLRAGFILEAGADIVWTERAGIDTGILPYARSEMTLGLGGGFDLTTRLRTSLDFETPADGYADWIIEGRAAIGYAVSQTARLEAAILASATRSVGFDIEHKRQWGGELSAQSALGEHFDVRASIGHMKNSGFAPDYDETRLGLRLAATL